MMKALFLLAGLASLPISAAEHSAYDTEIIWTTATGTSSYIPFSFVCSDEIGDTAIINDKKQSLLCTPAIVRHSRTKVTNSGSTEVYNSAKVFVTTENEFIFEAYSYLCGSISTDRVWNGKPFQFQLMTENGCTATVQVGQREAM